MKLKYITNYKSMTKIAGFPFAYWAGEKTLQLYDNPNMDSVAQPRHGLATSDNDRFLRLWFEVDYNKESLQKKSEMSKKWFPMSKGGGFRKWYGNNEWVINYEDDGKELKDFAISIYKCSSRTIQNTQFYFKKGLTWSALTSGGFSVRYQDEGFIFGSGGYCAFAGEDKEKYILALLNSKVTSELIGYVSPTLNFEVGHIKTIPVIIDKNYREDIERIVNQNIQISKNDWDSYEASWDFKCHPIVIRRQTDMGKLISEKYKEFEIACKNRFKTIKENEEQLNKIFIEIYGLQDELSPEVSDEEVSVRLANITREVKSLISYLVGVEMGRYSLDVEGLAYAGGDWNPMNYVTYQPDDDGIIPVYPQLGMADGLTARIIKLIKHIYGEDTYKENIDFIADALGKKSSESSEETLNRYLNEGFYADHLKTYQKRPIYWMFSSGKNDAFKCLVYLHRYNEDTLARINSKYFLNESARLNAEIKDTAAQLEAADGREKLRLDKLYKTLSAKQKEMLEYGWVLDHMANQYIPLDLDDGVKVNYAKFQGIEIVNDNGAKVKKDLLVPIK